MEKIIFCPNLPKICSEKNQTNGQRQFLLGEVGIAPHPLYLCSGGFRRSTEEMHLPIPGPNVLIFMQFLGGNWPNKGLACPHFRLLKLALFRKSWIRHCGSLKQSMSTDFILKCSTLLTETAMINNLRCLILDQHFIDY